MKKSPITRVNAARRARLFRRNFHSKEFVEFTRWSQCKTCGRMPTTRFPSQCSHTKPRGMGGCGGDWTTIIPQCWVCHPGYEGHRDVFLRGLQLTQDDIHRFTVEHRQAWERHATTEGITP